MSLFDTGIRLSIDAYLQKKSEEIRSYGDYWSASSAGYCMRRLIFERLGVPSIKKEGDERKTRVFEAGHIFHKFIQDITREAGLSIAQELELQDEELMVRGHIDDLVLAPLIYTLQPGDGKVTYISQEAWEKAGPIDPPDTSKIKQNLILYDYKTQHANAFTWQKGRPVSYYHRMQVGTYLYMLRRQKLLASGDATFLEISDLKEARILKISKDDLRMSEDQILWDAKLEKDVVGYWRTLNGYWKADTIPKCTCADHENGFLAKEPYNPYFYEGEPCSIKLYEEFKAKEKVA